VGELTFYNHLIKALCCEMRSKDDSTRRRCFRGWGPCGWTSATLATTPSANSILHVPLSLGSVLSCPLFAPNIFSCSPHKKHHQPSRSHQPIISKDRDNHPPVQISRIDGQTLEILWFVKVNLRSKNGPVGPTVMLGGGSVSVWCWLTNLASPGPRAPYLEKGIQIPMARGRST